MLAQILNISLFSEDRKNDLWKAQEEKYLIPGLDCGVCLFSLKDKKGRWRSLVILCTSKHKATQATALRWFLDISCDVRACLGSITWASCASSAPHQPELGNPLVLRGHVVFRQPQRARGVPAGLISWQHLQQLFQWLLPLVMLEAWKHRQAELPLRLCELPWGFWLTSLYY